MHRYIGEKILWEKQWSADQITRQPEHADSSGPKGQQAHRSAHPRATHAGRQDEHGPAHQESACRASRHPARRRIGIMHPGMQRRPIDAEVLAQQMLGEDQRSDKEEPDAEHGGDTPVPVRFGKRCEQRAAGKNEAQRRVENHRRESRQHPHQRRKLHPPAEHHRSAEEHKQRAYESGKGHAFHHRLFLRQHESKGTAFAVLAFQLDPSA